MGKSPSEACKLRQPRIRKLFLLKINRNSIILLRNSKSKCPVRRGTHMTWLRVLVARIVALFNASRLDRELDEELRAHFELLVEENRRKGMTEAQSRRAARHAFGRSETAKEDYREQRGLPVIETIWRDLRFALRMLARQPSFSLIAVATLTLGIGANAAIFTVVDRIMLRPLPYFEPERLVSCNWRFKDGED